MNRLKGIFLNSFYFKCFTTIIFVISSTIYTHFLYSGGVYIVVIWGAILFVNAVFRKQIFYRKADIFILLFLIGFLITMLLNMHDDIIKQGFVFMSCLMYFFSFFISDQATIKRLQYENFIIMSIVVAISFAILIVSYGIFVYDIKTGDNHTYNLHGGTSLQFIGIYTGLSTQAMISGISALASLGFVMSIKKMRVKHKPVFLVFHVLNFILQDIALTISYTSASIVALGCAIIIGVFFWLHSKINKKSILKSICILCIGCLLAGAHYVLLDYCSSNVINSLLNKNPVTEGIVQADEATSGVLNTNGRGAIWEAAIDEWKNAPVFGNGYGTFYIKIPLVGNEDTPYLEYRNVHSGYLEVLQACGAWGFVSIVLFGAYYILRYFKLAVFTSDKYVSYGSTMIIVHALLYAAINQLFILDRDINMFLICVFISVARKNFNSVERRLDNYSSEFKNS